MARKPRCKKCGRVLTSAASIARGMGPICAGITGKGGGRRVRSSRSSRRPRRYNAVGNGQVHMPLFTVESETKQIQPKTKKKTKKQMALERKQARRTLFDTRKAFELGINSKTKLPTVYTPVGMDQWKSHGRITTQAELKKYLERYAWI